MRAKILLLTMMPLTMTLSTRCACARACPCVRVRVCARVHVRVCALAQLLIQGQDVIRGSWRVT